MSPLTLTLTRTGTNVDWPAESVWMSSVPNISVASVAARVMSAARPAPAAAGESPRTQLGVSAAKRARRAARESRMALALPASARSRDAVRAIATAELTARCCQLRHAGAPRPTIKRPPIARAPISSVRRSRGDSAERVRLIEWHPSRDGIARSRDRVAYRLTFRGSPAPRFRETRCRVRVPLHPPPPPHATQERQYF